MRRFYVYIMASKSRVLYIGITSDIWRGFGNTRTTLIPGFTSKYKVHRLVYFETFKYVGNAINREKYLKGWLRERKVELIRYVNRTWEDLSEQWFDGKNVIRIKFDGNSGKTAGPSLRSG